METLELENKGMTETDTIKKLTIEIEESEEDKTVSESIAARAEELETEVSRLRHDLVTSMSEGEKLGAEVAELKVVLGEKGVKLESLEREVDGLKKEKVESEKKVRELERNVGLLEVREMEEKSTRVRVEKKVDHLETELDKLKSEKRESERKSKEMEEKILLLHKEIEEAEKAINGLKDKSLDGLNGTARGVMLEGDNEAENIGLNWQLPLAAITAAAVVCVFYSRWR